jgi:hypothetical protein
MAKLRILQTIVNENFNFVFTIDTDSIGDDDFARVKKFGAPSINFGGAFTNGTQSYTLPDAFYDFPGDFPVNVSFSGTTPFNTAVEANLDLYRTTMTTRITTAITTLRGLSDGFTGEFITNI